MYAKSFDAGLSFRCYCTLHILLLHHRCKQMCCYCSISRINNRRFSSHNNPSAWTKHSLKSTHSHSTLSHIDIYRLGASLCHSATSSITGKSVRHLGWVRNSCYCIEVLPHVFDVLLGVTYANMLMATQWPMKRAPHLTVFARLCVVWRSESSLELSALWHGKAEGPWTNDRLCMRSANERRCYNVTSCLIGWAHVQNDP